MRYAPALVAVTSWICAGIALAQNPPYPTKPIRMIVASTPGGQPDMVARMIGQKMTEAWGQQVVPDNRAGAAGTLAAIAVAKAAPDGHTLLMGSAVALAGNVSLYRNLPYDPVRDFAPISLVALQPNMVIVHPSLPVRTIAELIAYAKARPGAINYASSGHGSTQHLSGEVFCQRTGVSMVHVPYRGGAPALNDLIAGQVQLMFETIPTALQAARAGQVRPLAVTTLRRSEAMPDLPTVAESGLPGYETGGWIGLVAPAGTPRAAVDLLAARTQAIVRSPEVRVVSDDGEMLGVMPVSQALATAQSRELDLVEVNPKADPPVCKIMDFGKYKYEEKKKQRDAKKKQTQVEIAKTDAFGKQLLPAVLVVRPGGVRVVLGQLGLADRHVAVDAHRGGQEVAGHAGLDRGLREVQVHQRAVPHDLALGGADEAHAAHLGRQLVDLVDPHAARGGDRPPRLLHVAQIEELELQPPGPNEILVRWVASGICHSDYSVWDGTLKLPLPAVLGHEGAGIVEQLGPGVTGLAHVPPGFGACLPFTPSGPVQMLNQVLGNVIACAANVLRWSERQARSGRLRV